MPLNLVKLCVGADGVEDLEAWIASRLALARAEGRPAEHIHTTRMTPRRAEELLAGGSLYWVVKGGIQCRQKLVDIRPITDAEGVGRCQIVLDPDVRRTDWQPRRPFQGWRYLDATDAPADLAADGGGELPLPLRRELSELGLL